MDEMYQVKPEIIVENKQEAEGRWNFTVRVREKEDETQYEVTLDKKDWQRLTREEAAPEVLVQKSFEFLLDRESKDAILRKFNLWEINEYFSEYEDQIQKLVIE